MVMADTDNTVKSVRPTIYSIADQAGVSAPTVSRALRDDPLINIETRKRIRQVAKELGYRPSLAATRLAGGRTGMIAMLIPTVRNPFYAAFADSVIRAAKKTDHEVLVAYAEIDPAHERHILRSFRDAMVDGFIVVPEFWQESRADIMALTQPPVNRPVVVRQYVELNCPIDAFVIDFERAAEVAVEYLIELGHRDMYMVGYHCGPELGARPRGFKKTLERGGIPCGPDRFVQCGPDVKGAYQATREFLAHNNATAMVVHSDYQALGVLRAATELGIHVPRDLSILSFDGIEPAEYGAVPLTTMAQPIEQQAKAMVQQLVSRIEGDNSVPKRQQFSLELIVRASTGPVPQR